MTVAACRETTLRAIGLAVAAFLAATACAAGPTATEPKLGPAGVVSDRHPELLWSLTIPAHTPPETVLVIPVLEIQGESTAPPEIEVLTTSPDGTALRLGSMSFFPPRQTGNFLFPLPAHVIDAPRNQILHIRVRLRPGTPQRNRTLSVRVGIPRLRLADH